jgi:Tfp pilus assembly protein PilV
MAALRFASLVIAVGAVAALALHQFAYSAVQRSEDRMQVKVSARIETSGRDLLTVNVIIKNDGNSPVYVATRPKRSDGSPGPYVSVDTKDSSRLVVAMRFYPLPPFEVFRYEAGVHLV